MAEDAQNALSSLKTFKGRQIKISIADKKPRHQKRKRDDKKDTEVNDEGQSKQRFEFQSHP